MRIDFREERKWKTVLAYTLSTAVLEWHAAGTMEVRKVKGICVHWEPPQSSQENPPPEETVEEESLGMEVENAENNASLLGVDYGSDDGEEENDEAPQPTVDALEPTNLIEDALRDDRTQPLSTQTDNISLKTEHIDDTSMLMTYGAETENGDEENAVMVDSQEAKPTKVEFGLKPSSTDPVLPSKPTPSSSNGDIEQSTAPLRATSKNVYSPFRQMIADLDENELFLDLKDSTVPHKGNSVTIVQEASHPPDLTAIFPDLQVLTLLDIPPVVQVNPVDGKRRSEKSARDDPNKRLEDTTYTRLFPTGDLMLFKPTLLGPLRPSKNRKNGQWLPQEESPSQSDIENFTKISDERMNGLFLSLRKFIELKWFSGRIIRQPMQ